MKKVMGAILFAALVGALGSQAVLAGPEANCGGKYNAAVEVQQVDLSNPATGPLGVSYCSDGTLQEAGVPQNGDISPSTCADGSVPASVEADTGWLPENPSGVQKLTFCSDGVLAEVPA